MQMNIGESPMMQSDSFIKDTDEMRFEQDVLVASMQQPVIVDFWATWCMPCKQMMPALEKTVREANGKVLLVKVNIDKNPQLAQALRIQSVPTIYAFFQGKPIDGFTGAKSESELRAFVEKLKNFANPPSAAETLAEDTKKLIEEGDTFFKQAQYEAAMTPYSQALDLDPENMEALGNIGWCLLMCGDAESAREMLSQLTPQQVKSPRLTGLQFIFSLAEHKERVHDLATLEKKTAKNAKDFQAHFELSLHYFCTGQFEQGIEMLMTIIRQNREWEDKKARILLLEVFDALGAKHPLTAAGRRKLSAALFS